MNTDQYRRPRHPIRIVTERTGLGLETLRAWERRYGAVRPGRTEGGQRQYSDADVERLRLLARVTASGRSIGQVARLSMEELAALAREDRQGETPAAAVPPSARWDRVREAAEEAVQALDAPRLEAALRQGLLLAGAREFAEGVVLPLLRWLGAGWADGSLTVAHEHLASAVVRRVLGSAVDGAAVADEASVLVCATPSGQAHEFGALLVAISAASLGWRVVYLGADLPAEDIASAVRSTAARAVGLSVVYPYDDPALPGELRRLREAIPRETRVLVGGAGVGALRDSLRELGVETAEALSELDALLALPTGPAAAPA